MLECFRHRSNVRHLPVSATCRPSSHHFARSCCPGSAPESSFDAAIAQAFRQELVDYSPAAKPADSAKPAESAKPPTKFRTVDPDPDAVRPVRGGGPVVELEVSIVRGFEPVEAADEGEPEPDAAPERAK